jgi:hypothetical protein
MTPVVQTLFEPRVLSPRLGRRLVACAGLSVLLHATLVAWIRFHPVEFDFADTRHLFIFDASLKHEAPSVSTPAAT